MKVKRPKVRKFVEECLASGITSPSSMRDAYEKQWKKKLSDKAFSMALKRLGITPEQRKGIAEKAEKQTEVKDILEYDEVQNYLRMAEIGAVTQDTIRDTKHYLRQIWEWMGATDPHTWTFENLFDCIKTHTPMKSDERGRRVFESPALVLKMLSAFNTCFPHILPKGWSLGLRREAGELKDSFSIEEFNAFIDTLEDTAEMRVEGWKALYKAQVNMGCREGTDLKTGVLSLRWEDINFTTRRCSLREKGGRGKAGRIWKSVPLDLFPFIHGWDALMKWWELRGKPTAGRVFPINYEPYRSQFHRTRKKCNGRIAGDLETMTPHIFRKTHAQICKKLRVPLEQICGDFPDGRMGVGWDNPQVLLDFYLEIEEDEYEETEVKMKERMTKLGLIA